ncbi:MAG: leucine-rich repeat domain-containing protein [Phycisphaerae bacterium]|nr:leucine-rich repeat domain-containing protein [Phycisphaerae bacterium]
MAKEGIVRRLLFGLLVLASSAGGEPVAFKDARFQGEVEEALGVQDPNATDMLALKELEVHGKISDLSGIQYASNLERLSLDTQVCDLGILDTLNKVRTLELSWYSRDMPYKPRGDELTVLPDLSGMESLRELHLSGSQIKDISALSAVSSLEKLVLYCNEITDIDPVSVLTNLGCLVIREDGVTNFSALSNLTRLESLEMYEPRAKDLSFLAGLSTLEELAIRWTELDDISSLGGLTSLRSLEIADAGLKDISALAKLEGLETLTLHSNQISDISVLGMLKNLRTIDLNSNKVMDVSALAGLPKAQVLFLYDNPLNKDAHRVHFPAMRENNPDVAILCYVKTGNVLRDLKLPGFCILYLAALVWVSRWVWKRAKKRYVPLVIMVFMLVLVPQPVREKDIEKVLTHSVRSLVDDQRVIILSRDNLPHYTPFYDSRAFNHYKKLLYRNDTEVSEEAYAQLGLVNYRQGGDAAHLWGSLYLRQAIIEFTYYDPVEDKSSNRLHFNYYHGNLGAQGYRVVVYRNVFAVIPIYVFEWVS